MAKTIETDFKTFIKFWSVPLIIAGIILFLYKVMTGLIIIGLSIFLALALSLFMFIFLSLITGKQFARQEAK